MNEKKIRGWFFYHYRDKAKYIVNNLFCYNWESDLLVLLDNGYISEYEIKVSKEDLLNDKKKISRVNRIARNQFEEITKYTDLEQGKGSNRFLYIVPETIYDKCLSSIPEWAGIVVVREWNKKLYFEKKRQNVTQSKTK